VETVKTVTERFVQFNQNGAAPECDQENLIEKIVVITDGTWVSNPEKKEEEMFTLNIIENQITINSKTLNGVAHAVTTLIQLVETDLNVEKKVVYKIPSAPLHIVDESPAYSYRGFMLDTSRTFQPVTEILKLLYFLADAKLNVLHLHLTDSQSWPVQIDKYEQFTRYGAFSSEQVYSRQDIRKIVQFGQKFGITVIPEIDGPAHASIKFGNDEMNKIFDGSLV
jgi:hexosaminidase